MNQHLYECTYDDRKVMVLIGFDRPSGSYFMNIADLDDQQDGENEIQREDSSAEDSDDDESEIDDSFVYDSLAGEGHSLEDYRAELNSLGIVVPESMFREVAKDAETATGNRVARHSSDGQVKELETEWDTDSSKFVATLPIVSTQHEPADLIAFGPADHMPSGYVRFERYESNEIAIELLDPTFETMGIATVALLHVGAPHPGPFGVWLKDWSGNEGVPEALVEASLVKMSRVTFNTGFVTARHAELTPVGRDMYIRSTLDAHNREILLGVIKEMERKQSLTESQADRLRFGLTGRTCTKLLRDGLSIAALIEQDLRSDSRS